MECRLHVLVADDDPALLGTIAETLEDAGATVACARNGSELIELLGEQGPFDLVVTDVSMPWMTGLEAMQSTRHAGLPTPVIVMTALNDDSIAEGVKALGERAAFLRKPFGIAELEAAIKEALLPASESGAYELEPE